MYFCEVKLNFQHHYSSLRCHMTIQKIRNVLYNINVNIFVLYNESMNTEQHLFEIEIFCSIIPVFAVTFDQFHSFLLNKKGKKEGEIYIKPVFSSFKKRKSVVAVLK